MPRKYRPISIGLARRFARECDKDQVIIVTWDHRYKTVHVTTYGKTAVDCKQAADAGNSLKRALGWPDHLCNATPARIRRRKKPLVVAPGPLDICERTCNWWGGSEEISPDDMRRLTGLED